MKKYQLYFSLIICIVVLLGVGNWYLFNAYFKVGKVDSTFAPNTIVNLNEAFTVADGDIIKLRDTGFTVQYHACPKGQGSGGSIMFDPSTCQSFSYIVDGKVHDTYDKTKYPYKIVRLGEQHYKIEDYV